MTRICVTSGISGVPVGEQIACPLCTSSGCPNEVTRVVPVIHWAVTQGGMAEGGTPGHPATVQGCGKRHDGMASSVTAAFGTVGIACPPCTHSTVAPC